MIKASLIIIGDELLNGHIQDQHTQYTGKWLTQIGVHLSSVIICPDHMEQIVETLKILSQQVDLLIVSGGLGPTQDDKTKMALGKLLDSPLQENLTAKDMVTEHYQRFGKAWTPENNHYHLLPDGVDPIVNHQGLAPGLRARYENALILCAPGVPREYKSMCQESFQQEIHHHFQEQKRSIGQFIVRTHSIPEEKIFNELEPGLWSKLEQYGKVSSLPQPFGVDIIVTMAQKELERNKSKLMAIFNSGQLKENIWQYGNLDMAEYLIILCREKGVTLGLSESCTGGLTSSLFTDIAGCSDVYMGSAVTYSNEAKIQLLGVKAQAIADHGAVSTEVTQQMCEGTQKQFHCQAAISYSGVAGPSGGTVAKPVGTVAITVAYKDKMKSHIYHRKGDRKSLKYKFACLGMIELIKLIESV